MPTGAGSGRLGSASRTTPAWSPDGRKIAFVRSFDVYVTNVDGSGQRNLSRSPEREFGPRWSPDGQRIVFERRLGRRKYGECVLCGRATSFEVHVMNADGSGQQCLVRFRERASRSDWPDRGTPLVTRRAQDRLPECTGRELGDLRHECRDARSWQQPPVDFEAAVVDNRLRLRTELRVSHPREGR
jgi:dipeptidyl aminopeptidase/acylaminoacyl peptidase